MRVLFGFHLESNSGYAMTQYEKLFHRAGVELSGGDPEGLHFSFTHLEKGMPSSLPENFRCVTAFDYRDTSTANLDHLADYCRKFRIDTAAFVDMDAVHPVVSRLRKAGVKRIVGYWGAPISSIQPIWKLALKKARLAVSRNRLDALVFESRAMADTATLGRGFPASRIILNPLGVDPARWTPERDREYVYQALGIDRRRKILVFAGHMEERKGLPTLISAAVNVLQRRERAGKNDTAFLICGNRPGESEPYERMYADRADSVRENIRFGGYRGDLPQIYPGCYAGVLPSSGWDSYTYGAVEMASSGLPVVASRLQGLAEAVIDGETGWHVEPGNADALADRLDWILDHPSEVAAAGQAGRRRVESELTVEHQLARLRRILQGRSGKADLADRIADKAVKACY